MTAVLPAVRPAVVPARPSGPGTGELPGLRKAALLLAQLTPPEAGQVLPHLRPREVERLTSELIGLGTVDHEIADAVLAEFSDLLRAGRAYGRGGEEFAREILAAGLGESRAEDVLARLNVAYTEVPFSSLRNADVRQLVTFLKDEHPQLIALVLAHLPPTRSAEVLAALPPLQQAEIAYRIAVTERTSPDMVRLVEDELGRRMGSLLKDDATQVGGVESLVEIMNRSPRTTERSVLEWLEAHDPELAGKVRDQMFVFEDIVGIDDRSMQEVLREVDIVDLATALKGVRGEIRDKVLRNLSERAAENLQEEIDLLGAVRASAVEEAQARVVGVLRTLEESGQIVLSRGDDDMIA